MIVTLAGIVLFPLDVRFEHACAVVTWLFSLEGEDKINSEGKLIAIA
jgi:hypothetical protein